MYNVSAVICWYGDCCAICRRRIEIDHSDIVVEANTPTHLIIFRYIHIHIHVDWRATTVTSFLLLPVPNLSPNPIQDRINRNKSTRSSHTC
jgi:hypothetical protein